jgi:hypothetical protein
MAKILFIILLVAIVIIALTTMRPISGIHGPIIGSGAPHIIKDLTKFPASKFENHIRATIETMTGQKFPTVLPSWLKTKDGARMELDGYNEAMGLAFEAQGPLHTMFDKKADKSYIDYFKRIMADQWKIKKCEEEGVGLIVVDYKVPKYLMASYLKSRIYDIWASGKAHKLNLSGHVGFQSRPLPYVEPIHNPPYRNVVLERELGLEEKN